MIGAPFDSGTWEGITESYYAGAGGEAIWLGISVALCVIALIGGHIHEAVAYRNADRELRDSDESQHEHEQQ